MQLSMLIFLCVCIYICLCMCVCAQSLSCVRLFATPWTVALQAPLEFSRQEYWSGLPFPTPGDLPDPMMEPTSLASPALEAHVYACLYINKIRIILF